MMLHKHVKSISIFMMLSCVVFSQENRLVKADENFDQYAFIDAREIYLNVAESGYASADLYKKLGDSYYFNAELENAARWYEELINGYAEDTEPEYLFRYAQSLKSVKRYDEADRIMEKFSTATQSDQRATFFKSTRDYLNFIEMQSGKFELQTTEINSKYSDYAPSYDHQGKLVFASSRLGNTTVRNIHQWNDMPFLDLFSLDNTAVNDSLVIPRKLKGKINTRFHESSTAFSKDGTTVYFTRNNYTGGKLGSNAEGTILLKLYRATLTGDKWENIEELPFNSNDYSVAHPALSSDGTKLYFASDMPGSKGMSDLYVVSILEDGSFGNPQNLGDNINTEGRETFPYISNSGTLYFASDGHIGLGGLDVFVAAPEKDGSFSSMPYNVGRPVNSPEDDFSFILDEATKTGYFASNRNGGAGSDDIYGFTQTGDLITRCNQYISGAVTNTETNEVLANAEVILLDANNQEIARTVSDGEGMYSFDVDCDSSYLIKGKKEEYDPVEATFTTGTVFEQRNGVPLQMKKTPVFEEGVDLAKLLGVIIYFDSAKHNIRPDAATELQKIIDVLKEYPELKIDVRSHTDSRASARYNLGLSERRVQSTIKYIVEVGGIDQSRVTGRGYGESQLLNECKDRVRCSEEKHQLNRRSEFIVVE